MTATQPQPVEDAERCNDNLNEQLPMLRNANGDARKMSSNIKINRYKVYAMTAAH